MQQLHQAYQMTGRKHSHQLPKKTQAKTIAFVSSCMKRQKQWNHFRNYQILCQPGDQMRSSYVSAVIV